MGTMTILFFLTQLEQCYNPLLIAILMVVSAISGNITTAVFANRVDLHAGSGSMIYGSLGGFFAYLALNWKQLLLIRTQLTCMIGMITFFAMLFSIGGIYGFACFAGSVLGGFACGVGIFPPFKGRDIVIMLAGLGGVAAYWLTMFLIFYLAI